MPLACGVPEGSILGPLLNLCYVNDMPISVKCKLLLYADDSVLLVSDNDPRTVSDTLSKELESRNVWLVDNRLSLHRGKIEAMLCSTKQKMRSTEGSGVKCKDTSIEFVSKVKYLGINFDETLSREGILETVAKKCTGWIKLWYRQARCFPTAVKKILCQALVHCHLHYMLYHHNVLQ
ncbi:MAG: reverse transcriptase domain-containing protein [Kluyvera sp.]|uniref:reverse transcriptase domain-containing protein n=1 Tax=Kluyvera sp. TaxID=1538228 RepID=UPI003A86B106